MYIELSTPNLRWYLKDRLWNMAFLLDVAITNTSCCRATRQVCFALPNWSDCRLPQQHMSVVPYHLCQVQFAIEFAYIWDNWIHNWSSLRDRSSWKNVPGHTSIVSIARKGQVSSLKNDLKTSSFWGRHVNLSPHLPLIIDMLKIIYRNLSSLIN